MDRPVYYHYTSIPACLSILSTRSVWLTDHRFLNDKHELVHALEKLLVHFPAEEQSALKRALMWHQVANHHCVLSLSRSPSILSQWRAYADDGRGVAIGFDEQFLKFAKIELTPCAYEDHDRYAGELAMKYAALAREALEVQYEGPAEDDFIKWSDTKYKEWCSLVRDLIALKNPAFAEEQEVRAVIPVMKDHIKLRTRGDLIIPYTEAQFWRPDERQAHMFVVVPEIWLGPRCRELNTVALATLMNFCMIQRFDCGYV